MLSTIYSVDIVMPVYNEKKNILQVLNTFKQHIHTKFRVLVCYDNDNDITLKVLQESALSNIEIVLVKNHKKGAHSAVLEGFKSSVAPIVLVFPADDFYNALIVEDMIAEVKKGASIVCADRFMKGGEMQGCSLIKATIAKIANFTLYHIARLPTTDSSNGLRMFTRDIIQNIPIESDKGFIYSIELLVKAHRLGYKISRIPSKWYERKEGRSQFKVFAWLPGYFRWYFYGFQTLLLKILRVFR